MVPSPNPPRKGPTPPCEPTGDSDPPEEEFYLSPEYVDRLQLLFLAPPRRMITTTMVRSLYMKLQHHPKGVSGAYEEAINAFSGDLQTLLEAAAQFIEHRRNATPKDPVHTVSGRVGIPAFEKLEKILEALSEIRGVSRSKILGGIIQLHLRR